MSCANERQREDERPRGDEGPFIEFGRAAEEFGRRVARDATRFAERIADHASELARDIARDHRRARHEWRHAWRDERREAREHAKRSPAADDVREMFADVRGLVGDVLDGVDELVGRIFGPPPERPAADDAERSADAEREPRDDEGWQPIVSNREARCAACDSPIHPGDEAHLKRSASGVDLRCTRCGPAEPGR